MKIALVTFTADPHRGGAERYTVDIAAELARRGHDVNLLATRFGPAIKGVKFVEIPAKSPSRAGRYKSFLRSLDDHLDETKYDVVHSMLPIHRCDLYHPHAGMARAALQSHLSRENLPARAIAQLANRLNRKRQLYAAVEDKMLHAEPRPKVLCLSDYIKASILKHYPDIEGQLVKLFNGVDLDSFNPVRHAAARAAIRERFKIAADAVVALMIAQHFERKGLAELIAAAARIKAAGGIAPTILVVGKDDPQKSLLQAESVGIADKIIFAGTTSSPADFYAASDFFVLPTRHDSCSLVALEALAMGLPVISTIYNGACEIMTEAIHGCILRDPADVKTLAHAIQQLLDPQTRQTMHEACLALRPKLSFAAHVDRLEAIYKNLF